MAGRLSADLAWNYLSCVRHTSCLHGGKLIARSHDRAFLDAVATDIIHQHSQRLDYWKGNFSNFYQTKQERNKQQKKEYEAQLTYRQHLQAYIDRWRYNANRGRLLYNSPGFWLTISSSGSITNQDPGEAARARATRGRRVRDVPVPRAGKAFSTSASIGRSHLWVHTGQDHSQECQYRCTARFTYRRHWS
jgi:ATPase subunit of ABC transporter with duplicated ATPase domains